MFEQDYVMRLIKEMVRTLLKLLFHIDTDTPTVDLLEESEQKENLSLLLDMIDEGRINEAENRIYELVDKSNERYLELALLFYSYLNDKSDAFLEDNHFTREEIKQGLRHVTKKYGLESIADMFCSSRKI